MSISKSVNPCFNFLALCCGVSENKFQKLSFFYYYLFKNRRRSNGLVTHADFPVSVPIVYAFATPSHPAGELQWRQDGYANSIDRSLPTRRTSRWNVERWGTVQPGGVGRYLIYIILYYIINITFLKMSPFLNNSLGDVIINKQTPHVRFFPESHD